MRNTRNADLKLIRTKAAILGRSSKSLSALISALEKYVEDVRKLRTQAMQHDNIGELIRELNTTRKENIAWIKAARQFGLSNPEELKARLSLQLEASLTMQPTETCVS